MEGMRQDLPLEPVVFRIAHRAQISPVRWRLEFAHFEAFMVDLNIPKPGGARVAAAAR
jgi:hypothetical protein